MDEQDDNFEQLPPSKSALKRQMTALQKLGETLVELSDKELARMPIEDERVREVIHEARGIRSHSARRRHLQYLGKLMRDIDPTPIEAALEALHQRRRGDAAAFHQLEQWRERLLREGDPAVQALLEAFPAGDRQLLRQLLRQHRREVETGKPPAASRKLFRYLRELTEEE
jgi:ribosome-associated protein